jgi:hypothetical protein
MGAALAALAIVLTGGSAGAAETPKPLFADNGMIRLKLQGPIASLKRAPGSDASVAGTLSVQGAAPETLPVALSLRGITRRRPDICAFPPLWFEFTGKPAATSLFKGQKRLKLVTHCQGADSFQQYVLLEYAAYRMYQVLTPASFRARLATIDYVDGAGKPMTTRVGFLIEDFDDVAKRNGLKRLRIKERISSAQLSPRDAARFALFEYMISNLDWAMTAGPAGTDCCHNGRLMGAENATSGLIPVPYDFDYSGRVDAPYAVPPEGFRAQSVKARRYRGYCRHNAEVRMAAADMRAKRPALLAVLDETPELEPKTRAKAAGYLDGFFDQIATDQDVGKLLQNCIGSAQGAAQ